MHACQQLVLRRQVTLTKPVGVVQIGLTFGQKLAASQSLDATGAFSPRTNLAKRFILVYSHHTVSWLIS